MERNYCWISIFFVYLYPNLTVLKYTYFSPRDQLDQEKNCGSHLEHEQWKKETYLFE